MTTPIRQLHPEPTVLDLLERRRDLLHELAGLEYEIDRQRWIERYGPKPEPAPEAPQPDLLTQTAAARLMNCSRAAVRTIASRGELGPLAYVGSDPRYSRSAIQDYLLRYDGAGPTERRR